jgi:4-hydroxy-tetrahydrodipicolinate synthase
VASSFRGILVPLITPFTPDDRVDVDALHIHVDALIRDGVHGLIPAGSTGEAMSLDRDEYRLVLEETIAAAAERVPVIAGCSANPTRAVLANCEQAERLGADGIMLVHPFYSLPDEREIHAHYAAVSAGTSLPIIIYNNPFTTGVDVSPDLFGRLSELPHLDYVKESSGDVTRVLRILRASRGRMTVLCGTDNQALEQLVAGAVGWVAGVANAIPRQCAELYSLVVEQRRLDDALSLYQRIYAFLEEAELTGKFVQVNKAAVELVGRHAGRPRPPLLPLTDDAFERVRVALAQSAAATAVAA